LLAGLILNSCDDKKAKEPISGKIVFSSNEFGSTTDIFLIDVDGSNLTNLTNTPNTQEEYPMYSPDGSKIAYISGVGRQSNIYLMDADGGNQTKLTSDNDYSYIEYFEFSPDGSKILIHASPEYSYYDICVIDIDGNNHINLTDSPTRSENFPKFSPDGQQIAFSSDYHADSSNVNESIYLMEADGSNVTKLIDNAFSPQFSPDGKRIVFFLLYYDYSGYIKFEDIFYINPWGYNVTNLTRRKFKFISYKLQVSPSGSKIMFQSKNNDGWNDIYIMDIDGSNITNVTNNKDSEGNPQFLPNGEQIVFSSKNDIFIIDVDGSNLTNLTNTPNTSDHAPQCKPMP